MKEDDLSDKTADVNTEKKEANQKLNITYL